MKPSKGDLTKTPFELLEEINSISGAGWYVSLRTETSGKLYPLNLIWTSRNHLLALLNCALKELKNETTF